MLLTVNLKQAIQQAQLDSWDLIDFFEVLEEEGKRKHLEAPAGAIIFVASLNTFLYHNAQSDSPHCFSISVSLSGL